MHELWCGGVVSPVSPEEVLLLLRDFRQGVSVAQLPQLLDVPLGERDVPLGESAVPGHAVALGDDNNNNNMTHEDHDEDILVQSDGIPFMMCLLFYVIN